MFIGYAGSDCRWVTAVSWRSHKYIGCSKSLRHRVVQLPYRPKINLQIFARIAVNTDKHIWLYRVEPVYEPSNGRVAPFLAVILSLPQPDRGHLYALFQPFLYDCSVGLLCRDLLRCLYSRPYHICEIPVVGQVACLFQIILLFRKLVIFANRPTRKMHISGYSPLAPTKL